MTIDIPYSGDRMIVPDLRAKLIDLASAAMNKSYAPYSKFNVGSALITEKGEFYSGTNVENLSYGLSICAERSAVINAVIAEGASMKVRAIALLNSHGIPILPCGACRQVLKEFSAPDTVVVYPARSGFREVHFHLIFPGAYDEFDDDFMKKDEFHDHLKSAHL